MASSDSSSALRVAVIGAGKIFHQQHEPAIARARHVRLAAICDLRADVVAEEARRLGAPGFTDLGAMIAETRPDIVTVATDTASHARLTIAAARVGGVRAIHCEKPMALHPADARAMVAACREAGVLLTVNHQRRMGDIAVARRAIEAGMIGEPLEWRAFCAGDLLGDGTHAIDSLLALAGDPGVTEVLGALDLSVVKMRYGHPTEKGARLLISTAAGAPLEIACGSFAPRRAYQEYHVLGTRGALWRAGDLLSPNWFVQDGAPGTHSPLFDRKRWHAHPQPTEGGAWRPLENADIPPGIDACAAAYDAIAASLATGAPHPLDGARTLTVQDIIAAGYASGLRRAPVKLVDVATVDVFALERDFGEASPMALGGS